MFKTNSTTKVATYILIGSFFILLCGYFACGCNSKEKSVSFKHSPSDTIMTILVYKNNGIKWDMGYRICKDSFMFFGVDSVTQKKNWVRSSEYFIPLVDSLRDGSGKVIIDSASGKAKTRIMYYPCPSNLILADLNVSLDSLSKANPPK